jgi:hypothetical protein
MGMCMLYLGGMVLNGILDRHVDAVERPGRPIPSGRIPLRAAWTVAVMLILGGLWPSSLGRVPVPEIAAATVAIWLSAYAKRSANPTLALLACGWMAIAAIAAIWWMAVPLVTPIGSDVAEDLTESTLAQTQLGMRLTYAPALLIAVSAIAYNLVHTRTAWSVALMALCRALVPVSVAMAALAPSGIFGQVRATWIASGRIPTDLIFLVATPAIALMLHTLALSLAARREVDASGPKACSACGHTLAPGTSPARCSECGTDLAASPPSVPPAPEARAMGIVGTVGATALLVGVAILTPRLTASGWRIGAMANAQDTWFGIPKSPMTLAVLATVAIPLALYLAVALRGYADLRPPDPQACGHRAACRRDRAVRCRCMLGARLPAHRHGMHRHLRHHSAPAACGARELTRCSPWPSSTSSGWCRAFSATACRASARSRAAAAACGR